MAVTDTIAQMLTMIRNAAMAKKESVAVRNTKINNAILAILKQEGYIENFKPQVVVGPQSHLRVYLKYGQDKNSAIKGLKRISRPGLRFYAKSSRIPYVLNRYGRAIVTTSKGIMTDIQAREQKLGGEILCYVW